jgi:enoyl-CoA hydratase/carnithine racemase
VVQQVKQRLLARSAGDPVGIVQRQPQRCSGGQQRRQVAATPPDVGVAFGGGLQIALGADIRIAAPDAKLSVMEIKWGLVPDMSLTQTLRDLVPLDVAKELTFTGRILSGAEAKELGLVTRLADDPLAAALAMAQEIAGKSPDAIRAAKKLFEESWHADPRTGLELESTLQVALIGQPNQVEAVKANFENRAPAFKNAS